MTPEEKTLITGLFDRLTQTSNQPRDPEVEALIGGRVSQNPSAPYQLAQSTLVLQHALTNAQNRIADLERQLADAQSRPVAKQGGFLSSIFGSHQAVQPPQPPPVPPQPYQQAYAQSPQGTGSKLGGFLSGALTTAAGVAGGALLFRGIEDLLGHHPGPFSGAATPTGGFLNPEPVENITEVTNNYYENGNDQGDATDFSNDDTANNDFDPNLTDADDVFSDDSGFDDGGDDSSIV